MPNGRFKRFLISIGLIVNLVLIGIYSKVGGDFDLEYDAASKVMAGLSPYQTWNGHPPLTGLLFIPFTVLSPATAFIVFGILSIILGVLIAYLIVDGTGGHRDHTNLVFAGLLFWPNFMASTALGSLSVLVAALIVGSWYTQKRKRSIFAGTLLGLAILIKLYPGFLLFHLLLARQWRSLIASLTTVIGGFLLTILVIGADAHYQWIAGSLAKNTDVYTDFYDNISVIGIWSKFFGAAGGWVVPLSECPQLARWGGVGTVVFLVSICLWCLPRSREREGSEDAAFCLTSVTMLLISPLSWGHYTVVLALPLYFLFTQVKNRADRVRLLACTVLLSGLDSFLAKTLLLNSRPVWLEFPDYLSGLSNSMGLLMLFVILCRESRVGLQRS